MNGELALAECVLAGLRVEDSRLKEEFDATINIGVISAIDVKGGIVADIYARKRKHCFVLYADPDVSERILKKALFYVRDRFPQGGDV